MTVFDTATRALPETIANLDLGYLGRKLLEDDAFEAERRNGERLWDEERVERALREYQQFLALMYWNPETVLVPSEDIDEVWHTHVLSTARYQADCETIFGAFQHHFPTFDEPEEVQEEQMQGQEETLKLFEENFGEIPHSYTLNDNFKCGRMNAYRKCGRKNVSRKCGRMNASRKCGRKNASRKCGRMNASRKCGRMNASPKCGRMQVPSGGT